MRELYNYTICNGEYENGILSEGTVLAENIEDAKMQVEKLAGANFYFIEEI